MLPTAPLPWVMCPSPLTPLAWVSDTSNFPSKQNSSHGRLSQRGQQLPGHLCPNLRHICREDGQEGQRG